MRTESNQIVQVSKCSRQGSPFIRAHGSWLSWCPTTNFVPVKPKVSTGNRDRLRKLTGSLSNLKWPNNGHQNTLLRRVRIWTGFDSHRFQTSIHLLRKRINALWSRSHYELNTMRSCTRLVLFKWLARHEKKVPHYNWSSRNVYNIENGSSKP